MSEVVLPVRPATPESVAPYGRLIGPGSGPMTRTSPFYDGAVTTARPAQFESDEQTALSLCRIDRRPFTLKFMERHYKHTQAFLPLAGAGFIGVFGAPTESGEPDWDRLEALRFDGRDGFVMNIGTWHEFPFAVADESYVIVVLRDETTANLDNIAGGEAKGDDLDKLDVRQRTGRAYRLDVSA